MSDVGITSIDTDNDEEGDFDSDAGIKSGTRRKTRDKAKIPSSDSDDDFSSDSGDDFSSDSGDDFSRTAPLRGKNHVDGYESVEPTFKERFDTPPVSPSCPIDGLVTPTFSFPSSPLGSVSLNNQSATADIENLSDLFEEDKEFIRDLESTLNEDDKFDQVSFDDHSHHRQDEAPSSPDNPLSRRSSPGSESSGDEDKYEKPFSTEFEPSSVPPSSPNDGSASPSWRSRTRNVKAFSVTSGSNLSGSVGASNDLAIARMPDDRSDRSDLDETTQKNSQSLGNEIDELTGEYDTNGQASSGHLVYSC